MEYDGRDLGPESCNSTTPSLEAASSKITCHDILLLHVASRQPLEVTHLARLVRVQRVPV